MSTEQRYVPVKLIAGKEYVLRNGRRVIVRENPHWQCRVNYPFAVIQGPDFVVYYDEEGNTGGGTAHEHDIMRPVYKEGEVYLDRNGKRRVIDLDGTSSIYPLEDEERCESWTREGKVNQCASSSREDDLMDYEHHKRPVFAPVFGIPILAPDFILPKSTFEIAPPADPWMGKRVQFNQDGERGTGIVRGFDGTNYAVEVDDECTGFSGVHYCGNLVPGGRGWFVHPRNLTAIEPALQGKHITRVIVDDILAAPALAPIGASPSIVGVRVEVDFDCATSAVGVVRYEDTNDNSVAIEFDSEVYEGLHNCGGHVPSGRGWWVIGKESLRVVSEAETTVKAERSEAEALNELDVAEVWAAYRINPSIAIDSWIEARRVLKAAAK